MECGGETGPAECTGPACWESRALGPVVVCTQCCSSVPNEPTAAPSEPTAAPSEPTSCWAAFISSSLRCVSSSASGVSPEGDITLVYPNTSQVAVLRRGNTVCRHF